MIQQLRERWAVPNQGAPLDELRSLVSRWNLLEWGKDMEYPRDRLRTHWREDVIDETLDPLFKTT